MCRCRAGRRRRNSRCWSSPDGTTGSYILYDKTTLTPIATVNQGRHADDHQRPGRGQLPVVGATVARRAEDHQRRVFAEVHRPEQSRTPSSRPTSRTSIVPETSFLKLASTDFVPVTLQFVNIPDKVAAGPGTGPQPPAYSHSRARRCAAAFGGVGCRVHRIRPAAPPSNSLSGIGQLCRHQPRTTFRASGRSFPPSPTRTRRRPTSPRTLTAEQLAAIKAVEVPLIVVQDPTGKNIGQATWTYNRLPTVRSTSWLSARR